MKKLLVGLLLAIGISSAVIVMNPALATHALLFMYHAATQGGNLFKDLWHSMVNGEGNANITDTIVNKLYNTFNNQSIPDQHLMSAIQAHR
jgi:hypothetical protein